MLVALQLRPGIVSAGPLLPSIIDEFGLSHTQASLLTAIPTLMMGLLALPAPRLEARFGRDRVIVGALALLVIATSMRAFADSALVLFLTTAGIGAGVAVAGVLIASFVKARFPGQAAIFMSLYATSLAFGSTLSAAATGPIAVAAGWRYAAGGWALPATVGLLAWITVARRMPVPHALAPIRPRIPMPWASRTAWLIAIFFACNNFVFYAFIAWLAPMQIEAGYSATDAGLVLASFTVAFMLANPLFGFLSRNHDRRVSLAASAGIALLGIVLMHSALSAYIVAAIIAFGTGGAFSLAMMLPLDNTTTPEETSSWNAFVMLVSYTIAAVGPLAVGQLRDASGDFGSSVWMIMAVSGVMLATTPFLRPLGLKTATQFNPARRP
ncbi:CynX/NimT family MFS transporter [Massilia sp. CMS3.1]|uniref:MFS transporter n=1 Tax=Massilia sp. CMS3.1 TaxID=3373083 RepID=UPI003EE659DD